MMGRHFVRIPNRKEREIQIDVSIEQTAPPERENANIFTRGNSLYALWGIIKLLGGTELLFLTYNQTKYDFPDQYNIPSSHWVFDFLIRLSN